MTWTKHLSAFVSNFKAIRVVLRKLWLKNRDDPHSKSAHFMWFTQTETELIHVYTYVFCIQKPFPSVHYTINKQRRGHFCFLWSYLVIYKKFFFKIWRKWLLKFHEIFGLILFCWPDFRFLNAYSCVLRQNNASKFYFTFLSHHIFAYFFKIQGIKEEGFTPYGQSRDFYLGRVIYSQFTWFGVRRWGKRTPLISDCGRGVK